MSNRRMPVVFSGHGSPMLALEDTAVTRGLAALGRRIVDEYGQPKAILAISAHWVTPGSRVQRTENPRQVYDMYGFPEELYAFKYPVKGSVALADRVIELLGDQVDVDDGWGIDHGAWTVLCHVFPRADIPVVQLSIDGTADPAAMYGIGKKLAALRDEGVLIFASGNVVHNLRRVEWDNPNGSAETLAFNRTIIDLVERRDDAALMHYEKLPHAAYAVPTPEHYLPLIYTLGASAGERAETFNNHCELGAIAMTGFVFG